MAFPCPVRPGSPAWEPRGPTRLRELRVFSRIIRRFSRKGVLKAVELPSIRASADRLTGWTRWIKSIGIDQRMIHSTAGQARKNSGPTPYAVARRRQSLRRVSPITVRCKSLPGRSRGETCVPPHDDEHRQPAARMPQRGGHAGIHVCPLVFQIQRRSAAAWRSFTPEDGLHYNKLTRPSGDEGGFAPDLKSTREALEPDHGGDQKAV